MLNMRTSEKHRNKFLGSDQKFKNLFRNLELELKGLTVEKVDVLKSDTFVYVSGVVAWSLDIIQFSADYWPKQNVRRPR